MISVIEYGIYMNGPENKNIGVVQKKFKIIKLLIFLLSESLCLLRVPIAIGTV